MVDRRLGFVRLHVGWTVAAVFVLVALEAFSLLLFYVVGLIGFVLVYETTATDWVEPRWRRRVRAVAALLVVGFGLLAGYQVWRIVATV